MHLDSEEIQRVFHDEIPAARREEVATHLEECAACRETLLAARREEGEIDELLATLDHHPGPNVRPGELARRGAGGRWFRWAAVVVLSLGFAGAASAMPGSPVGGWIGAFRDWIAGPRALPEPVVPDRSLPQTPGSGVPGGVQIDPGEGLVVEISGASESWIRVSLTEEALLGARPLNTPVSFVSDVGRLLLGEIVSDTVLITIPATAPRVEVRTSGGPILVKDGPTLRANGDALEGPGPFLIPISSPGPGGGP